MFALLYMMGVATTGCSIGAFVAGAIPNWVLNRRWAWNIRGKVDFWREVFAYVVISAISWWRRRSRPPGRSSTCRASPPATGSARCW